MTLTHLYYLTNLFVLYPYSLIECVVIVEVFSRVLSPFCEWISLVSLITALIYYLLDVLEIALISHVRDRSPQAPKPGHTSETLSRLAVVL